MVEKPNFMNTRPKAIDEDAKGEDAAWSGLLTNPRVEAAVASVRRVSGIPPATDGRTKAPPPPSAPVRAPVRPEEAPAAHAPSGAADGKRPPRHATRSAPAAGRAKLPEDAEAEAPPPAEPQPERRVASTAPERRPARNRAGPAARAHIRVGQEPRQPGPAARRRLDSRVGKTGLIVGAIIAVLLHLFVFMVFSADEAMLIADRLPSAGAVEQFLDSVIRSLQAATST